ncbi:transcriptional regulator AfsR [Saccharothrix xinjiangensis]
MRARVLGPLEVRRRDQPVETGPVRQRVILALLLLNTGRPVPRARLVDVLWSAPPANAVNKVQGYVAALRNALEPGRRRRGESILRHSGGGYCLDVPRDLLDLSVFDDLLAAAAGARPDAALGLLRSALELWRGDVLADLGEAVADLPEVQAVRSRHRQAVLLAARLAEGRAASAALVPHLVRATGPAPLDEELHAALVVALHRCGRRAEALRVFHAVRERLAEELGVGPGTRLSEAYHQVLRPDADLSVPAQLPPDAPGFAGRSALVGSLTRRLTERRRDPGVVLLSGVAGAGKTALAVRVARLVAEVFPDGQLFADLEGTGDRPADPDEVLRGFLGALGVPDERVPAALPARTALFRSLLAHRRVLVVLDDARDAAQVRPLLPGSATNAVLLTSRSHLAALDVADRVDVGVLSTPDAVALLSAALGGPPRDGAGELVAACGHLPLALRIAAGRVLLGGREDLGPVTGLLRDERVRMDELRLDDLGVRASLMPSYRRLEAASARAFRLLAAAPCPAPSTAAAAVALGTGPDRLAGLLEPLVDAHLVRVDRGRCEFHGLVRAFGRERALAEEPEAWLGQARTRLAGWYLGALWRAVHAVLPGSGGGEVRLPGAAGAPRFTDPAVASSWLDDHEDDLVEVIRHAIEDRLVDTAVALAATERFGRYFTRRGHPGHHRRLCEAALDRACAEGDADGQALAAIGLGAAALQAGDPDTAFEHLSWAVKHLDRSGTREEATAWADLALVHDARGEPREALDALHRARQIYQRVGDERGSVAVLGGLGRQHTALADYPSALVTLRRALARARRLGLAELVADLHNGIGDTWRHAGDAEQAVAGYQAGLSRAERLGDVRVEAAALEGLGLTYLRSGHTRRAGEKLAQAADRYLALGNHPRAAALRAAL